MSILGSQIPFLECYPAFFTTAGDDVADLYEVTGRRLDESQREFLRRGFAEKNNGQWSALFNVLIEARQNGKSALAEAIELGALLLLGSEKAIHSAHRFDTSIEAFQKLTALLRQTPALMDFVFGYEGDPDALYIPGFKTSHGFESIKFQIKRGGRVEYPVIEYRTRAKDGGRGYSVDGPVILDEGFALTPGMMGDIVPTVSAKTVNGNPNIWILSSAGKSRSEVLRLYRDRAASDNPGNLNYMEFRADARDIEKYGMTDPRVIAAANPALGRRISLDYVLEEAGNIPGPEFLRERLGIWDEPEADATAAVISAEAWKDCLDEESCANDESLIFSVDIPPSRESGVIALASARGDGVIHVEVIDRGLGVGWIPQRLGELMEAYPEARVVIDAGGSVGVLQQDFRRYRVRPELISAREYAQGCGALFDAINSGQIAHIGQEELTEAVEAATARPLGDSLWKWNKRSKIADISPLVAVTLAVIGVKRRAARGGKSAAKRKRVLII